MNPAFMFSAILGVGPALLVIYYILRGFTAAFDEKRLFWSLAIGLLLGLLAFGFHAFLDIAIFPPSPIGFLIYVIGFAVLENLMLFAVLNFKWVRGKPEASFYGVALGAGFSASGVMALTYGMIFGAQASSIDFLSPFGIFSLIGIALASTFFRTSAGTLLGIGSATSEPWKWFGRAFVAQVPYGTMFMGLYYAGIYYETWLWVPLLAALLGYTAWLVRFIWRNSLPEFLPGEVKRKIRRERRRGRPPPQN